MSAVEIRRRWGLLVPIAARATIAALTTVTALVTTATLVAPITSRTALAAQQGVPPNPLGQPLLDASGRLRDDAFIHIPLRPEDARYADIEGQRLKTILLEVDAISLADRDAGNVF